MQTVTITPLRSTLIKPPKTVMRLVMYPPDKLFCKDSPPKTNHFLMICVVNNWASVSEPHTSQLY